MLSVGKPGHFGLQGMKERAERIGATLEIMSAPGKGTTITMTVPGRIIFRRASNGFIDRIRTRLSN
jgi:nitrate/nitrite-specific signal transduction histidine kinase